MEKVYVDCFYYGFWINKCDLHKYNLSEEYLNNKTNNVYKENSLEKCCNNKYKNENKNENKNEKYSTYNKIIEKISQQISNLTTIDTTNEDNYSVLYFKFITEQLFSYNYLDRKRLSYIFCFYNKNK